MTKIKIASITLIIAICLIGVMAIVFTYAPTNTAYASDTADDAADTEAPQDADITSNYKLYIVIGIVAILLLAIIIAAVVANKKYILAFIVGKHANPMQPQKYVAGADIDQLPTPNRVGAKFGGWYSDPYLKNEFTLTNMPNQDTYVYAKWKHYKRWYYRDGK